MLSQNENIQGPNQHQEIMIGRTKIIKLDLHSDILNQIAETVKR